MYSQFKGQTVCSAHLTPCPSDNPLFVPVNDSVLYKCDNEKPGETYLPLWNISGLSDESNEYYWIRYNILS